MIETLCGTQRFNPAILSFFKAVVNRKIQFNGNIPAHAKDTIPAGEITRIRLKVL